MVSSPQRAHTTRFQDQRRLRQRLPRPPHRKRTQDMSVSYDENIALARGRSGVAVETGLVELLSDLCDHCVQTLDHVFGGSSGTDVS